MLTIQKIDCGRVNVLWRLSGTERIGPTVVILLINTDSERNSYQSEIDSFDSKRSVWTRAS
jgi:hypothetical protein